MCISGLLPSISIEAEEAEIRHEICALTHSSSCPSYQEIGPTDFEFINMSGKKASVPQCKDGFEWDGRAVKELCGSGSIYVRITKFCDHNEVNTSSSDTLCDNFDVEIPESGFDESTVSLHANNLPVFETVVEDDDHISHADNSDCSHSNDFTSNGSVSHFGSNLTLQSSNPRLNDASTNSGSPTHSSLYPPNCAIPICIESDDHNPIPLSEETTQNDPQLNATPIHREANPLKDLANLKDIFPQIPVSKLQYIYSLSSCLFSQTVEFLLGSQSFVSLQTLAFRFQITTPFEESPCIKLEVEDDDKDLCLCLWASQLQVMHAIFIMT